MPDPKKMSIEEILAAARAADGGESSASDETPAESAPAGEPAASEGSAPVKKAPAAKPAGDARKMSVEEMLAAARSEKSGDAAADEEQEAESQADDAEAAAPAASGEKLSSADARKMSVAEMMAAARGEKSKPKAAAPSKAAPKKKAPAKASPKKAEAAKPEPSGPKDTASILAAARKQVKPGPVSTTEARAKQGAAKTGKKKLEAPPMPERPAYATPPSTAEQVRPAPRQQETRRGFLASAIGLCMGTSLGTGFFTLAITHVLWVLGFARYMFPNIRIEPPTKFKVGFPEEFSPGQVEEKYKAQFGVWIVRYEYEGKQILYALKSVCTHLGCTPNWLEGEQKFKCPCHGSGFYKDGINFEGPAPRPLERYAMSRADDGQLEVDKSRTFFQEKGDWKDAASFVEV